jgi:hypothetical protein
MLVTIINDEGLVSCPSIVLENAGIQEVALLAIHFCDTKIDRFVRKILLHSWLDAGSGPA